MKNHWFLTPVFAQIDGYVSLRQNGPSNYTSDRSSKRPVATGLGPVFQISQNPGNCNRTDHQRAWTATVVRSFFGPVQFGLRSFCGPRTGLLNTSDDAAGLKVAVVGWLMSSRPTPEPALESSWKSGRGFYHDATAWLICPVDYDWSNSQYACLPCLHLLSRY